MRIKIEAEIEKEMDPLKFKLKFGLDETVYVWTVYFYMEEFLNKLEPLIISMDGLDLDCVV